ncbi:2-amino-4-hydroxy-6-hydroxymethyldihydropteridine diphosphokinase [Proteinivorax tanatarense]|uniref:2-amino-4-hydroxy-6-hydroxymethyldihydropteridine diphosphokinase n=1 Tax=Proteinivorax tanatarense TaxID=1260629 RepID=A0AAU7VJU2_9FIRM
MAKVYLGLGSNIGDKKAYLLEAIKKLESHKDIFSLSSSSFYETDPVGYKEQDSFLNLVVVIETGLLPYELLSYINEIETQLHRKRTIRWGPRTIDIDILLYENFASDDEKLTIPHPRMKERAFVMIPLWEINNDILIDGSHIQDIVKKLDSEGIRRVT